MHKGCSRGYDIDAATVHLHTQTHNKTVLVMTPIRAFWSAVLGSRKTPTIVSRPSTNVQRRLRPKRTLTCRRRVRRWLLG